MEELAIEQELGHDQFLQEIAGHLDYTPDSANYDLYKGWIDAGVSPQNAFIISILTTQKVIELYDNDVPVMELFRRLVEQLQLMQHHAGE